MIKWIVIAIIGLIVLGYLGIDIQKTVKAPTVQNNLTYAKDIAIHIWKNYLAEPAKFIWELSIKYIWKNILNIIKSKEEKTSVESGRFFSVYGRGVLPISIS